MNIDEVQLENVSLQESLAIDRTRMVMSVVILTAWFITYFRQRRKLKTTNRQARNHHLDWEDDDE